MINLIINFLKGIGILYDIGFYFLYFFYNLLSFFILGLSKIGYSVFMILYFIGTLMYKIIIVGGANIIYNMASIILTILGKSVLLIINII